ncbi:MAG: hypothetical protein EXR79_03355 [Myxococcales bacterium]|nr:hypothetical protein [Myxococcales bacterium]
MRHPLGDGMRVRVAGRMAWRALAGHAGDAVPSLRLDWPAYGLRHDATFELREAYVAKDFGPWGQWTLGRDVADWGALELQSPLRLLNPVDFRFGFAGALQAGGESASVPDFMLRGVRPFDAGTLEVVVQPFFAQHRFSAFATDTAVLRPGFGPPEQAALLPIVRRLDLRLDRALGEAVIAHLDAPPPSPAAASVAARFKRSVGPGDLALDVVYGWERPPMLAFDADVGLLLGVLATAGFDPQKQFDAFADAHVAAAVQRVVAAKKGPADLVRASWQRRFVLGVEWAGAVAEGWTVKVDLAHSLLLGGDVGRVVYTRAFAPLRTALSQVGLGVEWQHGDSIVVLAEGLYSYAHDVPDGTQLFLQARHHATVGAGAVVRWGDQQQWTLQLGGLWGVSLGDLILAPRVAWAFGDGWTAGAGAVIANGPPESPGGLFDADDQVVLDVQRSF